MDEVAIRVESLSKRYRIGERERYYALRDLPAKLLRFPTRWHSRQSTSPRDGPREIWALHNVTFELRRGDVVGVIGRNGAGKSTLLKLLSRITEPTRGRAEIHGSVGSLLEVGTGFHPELTGRENVYFNGALLGMKKLEVRRKFDEIVSFAEIDNFIDTPVKYYSSGMQLRLAFAVAAHLDTEILLLDEVLAVGDIRFRERCLAKVHELTDHRKTVLFVSHDLSAIQQFCTKGMLLNSGTLDCLSGITDAVDRYVSSYSSISGVSESQKLEHDYSDGLVFQFVSLASGDDVRRNEFSENEEITISFSYCSTRHVVRGIVGCRVAASDGTIVFVGHWDDGPLRPDIEKGLHAVTVTIPSGLLLPGRYVLGLGAVDSGFESLASATNVANFEIRRETDITRPTDRRPSHLRPPLAWTVDA
jgi:lipopolysaccharide transport system ATP-binding protein